MYEILSKSTDYDQLLAVWKGWRDTCRVMKPKYVEYIHLSNKAINELGNKTIRYVFWIGSLKKMLFGNRQTSNNILVWRDTTLCDTVCQ